MPDMDPLYQAMSCFRRRQYDQCVDLTSELLAKNPNDQVRRRILEEIHIIVFLR